MKRSFLVAVALAMLISAGAAQVVALGQESTSDKNQDQGRNLTGQVMTRSDAPLADAVVYLKNTKSLTIKSFITEKDGGFRFHGLSPNVDYEIYADYQGQKSATKTISSFDTRNNITLNIHIDAK
ncbi:MAG TPA: carboxypeptidase-like regulatory domain-containing protein [Terriglobales bacterium]|jgi:hypothetical protein|nr:carboxypeptidase-like regulatory domain-containing protein [Terriglobales bacterium]